MKRVLSLCAVSLLLSCGETHIKSVDDETIAEATAEKAAADLKNEQTALLGTWRGCFGVNELEAHAYEYAFGNDGKIALRKTKLVTCTDKTDADLVSENLSGTYKVTAKKDSPGFTLSFALDSGKKLETEYTLSGSAESKMAKVFELKDQPNLGLVELKDKAKFVGMTRLPPGEAETWRRLAEQKVMNLALTQVKRKGVWRSDCSKQQQTVLQFTSEKALTRTTKSFKDEKCETLDDTKTVAQKYGLVLDSVTDVEKNVVKVLLVKADTSDKSTENLRVSLDVLDAIELNAVIYVLDSTGGAP